MAEKDELTIADLKEQLAETFAANKVQYSERMVARVRNDLGWTFFTARYCQTIQDANKDKRVVWCQKCLDDKEKFHNVIFTDESQFTIWKATEENPSRRIMFCVN